MLKPLHDNVVLKVEKAEKVEAKTASGIFLPGESKEEPSFATVVAIGQGTYIDGILVPMSVKVGDKVVYKKYSPTEVEIDDEEYLIISEKDILAIVK